MNKRTTHLKTSLFLPTHAHICFYQFVCVRVCVRSLFSWATAHFLEHVVVVAAAADRVCVAFYQCSRSHDNNNNKNNSRQILKLRALPQARDKHETNTTRTIWQCMFRFKSWHGRRTWVKPHAIANATERDKVQQTVWVQK